MIEDLSAVVLTADLPQHDLRAGDVGTVVSVHQGGKGYTVEFATLRGETIAVVTLPAEKVRATRASDIAHVREMTSIA